MEKLELHFTTQGFCDGSPGEHISSRQRILQCIYTKLTRMWGMMLRLRLETRD